MNRKWKAGKMEEMKSHQKFPKTTMFNSCCCFYCWWASVCNAYHLKKKKTLSITTKFTSWRTEECIRQKGFTVNKDKRIIATNPWHCIALHSISQSVIQPAIHCIGFRALTICQEQLMPSDEGKLWLRIKDCEFNEEIKRTSK